MGAKRKSVIYTKEKNSTGLCHFQVWNPATKRLELCGKGAHYWRVSPRIGHYLCDEHGEFWADAHDLRDVLYQGELLKADK